MYKFFDIYFDRLILERFFNKNLVKRLYCAHAVRDENRVKEILDDMLKANELSYMRSRPEHVPKELMKMIQVFLDWDTDGKNYFK